jgi:uncharacterized OB-fold protein
MNELNQRFDRTCQRIRSVIETDDAGVNHRMNKYCGRLLAPGQGWCEECQYELTQESQLEIQR